MKIKVAVWMLLAIFIAPSMTAYFVLTYQKAEIKKTVSQEIPHKKSKDQLVLLKFSKEDSATKLRWEHPREFEYNFNMYDIVEIILKEDSIYYWCYWDKDETEINQKIHALLAEKQQSNPLNKTSKELVDYFLKSLFINDSTLLKRFSPAYHLSIKPHFDCSLNAITIPPPTPPPKLS